MTPDSQSNEKDAMLTDAEWHEVRVECAPPTDYGILRGLIERIVRERLAQAWDEGWEHSVHPKDHNPYRVIPPGSDATS